MTNGATALIQSSKNSHLEVVAELLAAGAGKGLASKEGFVAIQAASQSGDIDVVRCLVKGGVGADGFGFGQYSPLYYAAANGR